ncbi:MAG: hypothetical protein PH343_09440, partial [Nitrospira sp.]|nr:hypothetical protein [Nitrospira sp.]
RQVMPEIEKELYRYINPLCGGNTGDGWPFGRSLNSSEIHGCLQKIDNIDYIEDVKLFQIDAETGERLEAASKINISPDAVICSRKHDLISID